MRGGSPGIAIQAGQGTQVIRGERSLRARRLEGESRAARRSELMLEQPRPLAVQVSRAIGLAGQPDLVCHTFTTGAVADADQVNANFTAVATAVNDNDGRISTLENLLGSTCPPGELVQGIGAGAIFDCGP